MRILYHGGLAPRFGVETAIRAVGLLGEHASTTLEDERTGTAHWGERVPEVCLRVCGSGQEREHLAALAAQVAPGRVEVTPEPVPFERIPAELERAHIGVVPTLHDSFTELLLPVKLLEYVHMGLPVVSSRLPCISDYFREDEDVSVFTPGEPHALAAALRELCLDPDGAHRRATSASRRLREIAWERQRARYLTLVDELAGSRSARAAGAGAADRSPDKAPRRPSASAATVSASPTSDSPLSSRG